MPGAVTFVLDNPTISRVHAVVQFRKKDDTLHVQDLGSTHGTFVNKQRLPAREWQPLLVGDLLQFGQSTRLYLVTGPEALARPEVEEEELQAYRVERGKVRAWREGRRRRKEEQEGKEGEGERLEEGDEEGGGGVTWGMAEDAAEEEGEEGEEGREEGERKAELPDYLKNLPEHQRRAFERGREGGMGMVTVDENEVHEKDRKLFERLRAKALKIEHMESEIGRIYAKENSQGGLTDGQRQAVARNEERIEKLKEEVEDIEEQIRGKNAARLKGAGKGGRGLQKKKKGGEREEDGEEGREDEDDFFDRAKAGGKGAREGGGTATNWRVRRGQKKADGGGGKEGGRGGSRSSSSSGLIGEGGGKVETYESLSAKLAHARLELEKLEAAPPSLPSSLPPSTFAAAAAGEGGKEEGGKDDTLERFMVENEAKKQASVFKGWVRKKEEVEEEIRRLAAVVEMVRPALPSLRMKGGREGKKEEGFERGRVVEGKEQTVPQQQHVEVKEKKEVTLDPTKEKTLAVMLPHPPSRVAAAVAPPAVAQAAAAAAPPTVRAAAPPPAATTSKVVKGPSMPPPPPPLPPPPPPSSSSSTAAAAPPPPHSSSSSFSSFHKPALPSSLPGSEKRPLPEEETMLPPSPPLPLPPPSPSSSTSNDSSSSSNSSNSSRSSKKQKTVTIPSSLFSSKRDVGENEAERATRKAKAAEGEEAYVAFYHKPKDQKGDGRTALNDKLGY
ncbi:smad fha domain-containing protein [Nannochloropsis oceanica]